MKTLFIAAASFLILSSCSDGDQTDKAPKEPFAEQKIFDYDAVSAYLLENPKDNKESKALFSKAIDEYRNKKDPKSAIEFFRTSIVRHPSAKAYYEMSNAYLDLKNYQLAIEGYAIAEKLGYKPLSKLLYNMACAYSRVDSLQRGIEYLEYAIEAGYTNTDQIEKDPDLANLRNSGFFQSTYISALGGASDPEKVLWNIFRRSFAMAVFPVTIDNNTRPLTDIEKEISYDYERFVPDMRTEKFSREVGKSFYFVSTIAHNDRYSTLMYAMVNTIMGDRGLAAFYLVSYSPSGNIIDKMQVAGIKDVGQPFFNCTIQQNLNFKVSGYTAIFEKDPEQDGYENNKMTLGTSTGTKTYIIGPEGKFEEQAAVITMR